MTPSLIVPNADSIFPGMFMQDHPHIVPGDVAGVRVFAGFESGLLHRLIVHQHRDAICHLQTDDLSAQFDNAQKGRRTLGQCDLAHRVRAHQVSTGFQPAQAGQRQPAIFTDEVIVFLGSPSKDLVFVFTVSHTDNYNQNRRVDAPGEFQEASKFMMLMSFSCGAGTLLPGGVNDPFGTL